FAAVSAETKSAIVASIRRMPRVVGDSVRRGVVAASGVVTLSFSSPRLRGEAGGGKRPAIPVVGAACSWLPPPAPPPQAEEEATNPRQFGRPPGRGGCSPPLPPPQPVPAIYSKPGAAHEGAIISSRRRGRATGGAMPALRTAFRSLGSTP